MSKRIPAQVFHPGEFVKDEMDARGWNIAELTKRMGHHVSAAVMVAVIECRQSVIPIIAFGLHRAFGTSVDFWLNLQKAYDTWQAEHSSKKEGSKVK